MSDEATVLTDEADGVLVITINRPEAKNAVNLSVAQGVAAALERLDSDDSLRVGVLTGQYADPQRIIAVQPLKRSRDPLCDREVNRIFRFWTVDGDDEDAIGLVS